MKAILSDPCKFQTEPKANKPGDMDAIMWKENNPLVRNNLIGEIAQMLTPRGFQSPQLYSHRKLHKPGVPFRPLLSMVIFVSTPDGYVASTNVEASTTNFQTLDTRRCVRVS